MIRPYFWVMLKNKNRSPVYCKICYRFNSNVSLRMIDDEWWIDLYESSIVISVRDVMLVPF